MSLPDTPLSSQTTDVDAPSPSPSHFEQAATTPLPFPTPSSQSLTSPDLQSNHQTSSPSLSHSADLTPSLSSAADAADAAFPSFPPSSSPPSLSFPARSAPAGHEPARALARAGQGHLNAAITHLYQLLAAYQRLSDVNPEALTHAAQRRAVSDAEDARVAHSIETQRNALHEQLASLHAVLLTLHDREHPKVGHPARTRRPLVRRCDD